MSSASNSSPSSSTSPSSSSPPTIDSPSLLRLLDGMLQHTSLLHQYPALSWQVPELQRAAETLRAYIALPGAMEGEASLRAAVRDADATHDDRHRYLHGTLTANLAKGTPDERATVLAALTALYPDKLGAIIQAPFETEAANAEVFTKRLRHPDAEAGLTLLATRTPDILHDAQACIDDAQALGTALRAVDAHKADAAGQEKRALFKAYNHTRTLIRVFQSNANLVLDTTLPEERQVRETLLGPWERAMRGASQPTTTPTPDNNASDED